MIAVMVLPPSLVFVGWLSLLGIAGITGRHPIWSITPENLPEAAAFRDPVAVVQHLARGEHIDRAAHVRTGMGRPDRSSLTPIEAAAALCRMRRCGSARGAFPKPPQYVRHSREDGLRG
jgi:hypothetical protein